MMNKLRLALIFLGVFIVLSISGFACTTPLDNLTINNDVILCNGTYNIIDGGLNGVIIINASDITLECNNTLLNGTGTGYGFNITKTNNIIIKNCNVYNYGNYQNYVYNSSNVTFRDSVFSPGLNKYAFTVMYSDYFKLINITLNGSRHPMEGVAGGDFIYSSYGLIENITTINQNYDYFFFGSGSDNWVVRNNLFYNTSYTFGMDLSTMNTLFENNVFNHSGYPDYFFDSNGVNTTLINNVFANNGANNILLGVGSYNLINNTFININTIFDNVNDVTINFKGINTLTNVNYIINDTSAATFYITQDSIFPQGNYYLNDSDNDGAIIINASNIVVDCNGVAFQNFSGKSIFDLSNKNNVTLKNCNIKTFNGIGMVSLNNSNLTIYHSTLLTNNGNFSLLDLGSNLNLYNSTFDKTKANIIDTNSLLNLYWYLFVNVSNDASVAIENASVNITNKENNYIANNLTNSNGLTQRFVLQEYYINSTTEYNYNNFTIHLLTPSLVYDNTTINVNTSATVRAIVTVPVVVNLEWSSWDNTTTNLSLYNKTQLVNIKGLNFSNAYGDIIFTQNTSITQSINISQSDVHITQHNILVNSTNLPSLNKSATLVFREVNLINPIVKLNGVDCLDSTCQNKIYDSTARTFNVSVPFFSAYSLTEQCVDGIQNYDETDIDCGGKCSACSGSSSTSSYTPNSISGASYAFAGKNLGAEESMTWLGLIDKQEIEWTIGDFDILSIKSQVKQNTSYAKLSIKFTEKPGVNEVSNVYKYLEISLTGTEFDKTKVEFRVNNSWIINYDKDKLVLSRYANGWQDLTTIYLRKDARYHYYEAETPGFSFFAIKVTSSSLITENPGQAVPVIEQQPSKVTSETLGIVENNSSEQSIKTTTQLESKSVFTKLLKSIPLIPGIIVILVVIIIVTSIVLVVQKKPKTKQKTQKSVVQSGAQKTINEKDFERDKKMLFYIKTKQDEGMQDYEIIEKLSSVGWEKSFLEDEIKKVGIIRYIEFKRQQHMIDSEIRQALLSVNWKEKIVDEIFKIMK